jgi:ligand-binding sensor domain-containing protein/signal transduction histidine kinase
MPRAILPLAVLLPALSHAQQLPIRYYTVADGLAEDRVNGIVADSRGYVWIATSGGLSRFDGYRIKTYGVEDGLPYRTVTALLETPSGAYLVGASHGLCRLENRGHLPFTAYPLEGQAPSVEAFLMEPSGRILIGSTAGLFEASGGTSFRRLPLNETVGNHIEALARDHDGNLWISTEIALVVLTPKGASAIFRPGRGLPAHVGHAAAMLEQPPGRMWVATNLGVVLFVRADNGEWSFNRLLTKADGLVGNDIAAMETDSEGRLWLGTSAGISTFAPEGPLPPPFENFTMARGLSGPLITALARDSAGNMWAGTENAGVMRIARQGFVTYHAGNGLKTERIAQVLEDRSGELLTVTQGNEDSPHRSFAIFDGVRFRPFFPNGSDDSWAWQQILLQARNGDWWTGTTRGLLRYPPMKAADLAAAHPILYPANRIFYIFEDSQGGIWASAIFWQGQELTRWDPASHGLSWFRADGTIAAQASPFGGLVSAMAEDRGHNIWMGLLGGGLLRYAGGRFTRFGPSQGIPPGAIRSLFADRQGRLWIGTTGGGLALLAQPTAPDPHFDVYTKARGLSSNSVGCIVDDAMGRIYLATARGVDRLDPETGHVRHFSALEGVPSGGFTSAIRDRSGALWFASLSGLSRLVPEPNPAPHVPKVLITGLQAGGEDYAISQLGESRIAGLSLSPSRNRMQVEFVAPGDDSDQSLRYRFMLTGADSTWTEPRAQHSVDYRNLAAGSYRFLVKAVDPEGHESANTAEVSFVILPPLWRRWWFESILLAAALALAYGLHAYRLKNILALERMRTAIATDLHDDIGTSLAQIAVLSEVAQVNGAESVSQSDPPLARIGDLAREVTDSVNDIVWSIRSGDESLESLTRRMREFAAEFLEPAGIEFSWAAAKAPPGLKLTLNSRRQIFLIYKECMHNLLKHSGCRAARITFEVGNQEAVMTVADNGKGLNGSSRSQSSRGGNGLSNMRRRAESMAGSVEFSTSPGGGCQVTLRLPVRKRAFGDFIL